MPENLVILLRQGAAMLDEVDAPAGADALRDAAACIEDLRASVDRHIEMANAASHINSDLRTRLLPALDAAGVRFDDPPEALKRWIERQEEDLDRLSGENRRLTEALRVAEAEKADAVQARDQAVLCYTIAVRPDLAGPAALDDELPEPELRTPEMRIRSLHLRTAFWTLATLAQAHKGAVNHLAFTMSLGSVPKDAPPEMHQFAGWSLEVAAIRPGGKGPSRMLAEARAERAARAEKAPADARVLAGGLCLAEAQFIDRNAHANWSHYQREAATRALEDAVQVFGFASVDEARTFPCAELRTGNPVPAGGR